MEDQEIEARIAKILSGRSGDMAVMECFKEVLGEELWQEFNNLVFARIGSDNAKNYGLLRMVTEMAVAALAIEPASEKRLAAKKGVAFLRNRYGV
jgi:hypothetical protein